MSETLLVLTTMPNHDSAVKLAGVLVNGGYAACVNISAPVASIYRWQDELQHGSEVMLTIKTSVTRYPDLEQAIVDGHPYELPEVIAVPITAGLDRYLAWIDTCTKT